MGVWGEELVNPMLSQWQLQRSQLSKVVEEAEGEKEYHHSACLMEGEEEEEG